MKINNLNFVILIIMILVFNGFLFILYHTAPAETLEWSKQNPFWNYLIFISIEVFFTLSMIIVWYPRRNLI